jgi:ubiquinone/menaquinone biosynthesis C-methylase UbiE
MITAVFILSILTIVLIGIAIYFAAAYGVDSWFRAQKKSRGDQRGKLYERLYGLPWGNVATNNYGYSPAETDGPERFQLQIYQELYKLLAAQRAPLSCSELLEVSCGRGGGLVKLVQSWPGRPFAVGLDYSENALRFCRRVHGDVAEVYFVRSSALELPFATESFDVVLNVEASHNYGDDKGFFQEVHRVLRPQGAFLYADYRRPHLMLDLEQQMHEAGLEGEFRNITSNVAEACRLDSERRRQLIRQFLPWHLQLLFRKQLANYGAIEGSRKYEAFQTNRRFYFLTCAIKL